MCVRVARVASRRALALLASMKVTFTPLTGARNGGPCCYLLELENAATLLLDCGWDGAFDIDGLAAVAAAAPRMQSAPLCCR